MKPRRILDVEKVARTCPRDGFMYRLRDGRASERVARRLDAAGYRGLVLPGSRWVYVGIDVERLDNGGWREPVYRGDGYASELDLERVLGDDCWLWGDVSTLRGMCALDMRREAAIVYGPSGLQYALRKLGPIPFGL